MRAYLSNLIPVLQERLTQHALVFDHTPVALLVLNLETQKIVEANDAWRSAMGCAVGPLPPEQEKMRSFFYKEDAYTTFLENLTEQGFVENHEYVFLTAGKNERTILVYGVRFEHKTQRFAVISFLDVTPLRHWESLSELFAEKAANLHGALFAANLITVTDAKGHILDANDNFCRLSQYSRQELVGKDHSIVNSQYHSKEFMRHLWQTIKAGKIFRGEIRNRAKDGSIYWLDTTIVPFVNEQGKPFEYYAIHHDITKKKESIQKLLHSHEALLHAQALAHLGSWQWNSITHETTWSPETFKIFGLDQGKTPPATDISIRQYLSVQSRDKLEPLVREALETGKEYAVVCEIIRTDQSRGWAVSRGTPLKDEAGGIIGLRGTIQDITEQYNLRMQLTEHAALLDKTNDAIIVRKLDNCVVFWNHGAERIYGYSKPEAIGGYINALLYDDLNIFDLATDTVLKTGEFIGELKQKTKDGRHLYVHSHWTLLRDEQGQPQSVLVTNTDITGTKKLEQQFLRTQRLESIGTLASGIAHDLNNMMTPISLSAALLRTSELSSEQLEYLQTIENATQQAANLLRQVLGFVKGVEGDPRPLDLRVILKPFEELIRETFPRNIDISVALPEDLWQVSGDTTQLYQVFMNLAVNSRDAMPEGGQIIISCENKILDVQYVSIQGAAPTGPYVVFSIVDTGCGIADENLEKIFEPFFTTKGASVGTGLGLSTVFAIIKAHQGFIRAYSIPDHGTQFHIYLPALLEKNVPTKPTAKTSLLPRGNGELILVVDDEESVRNATCKTLNTFGYRTHSAKDGADALTQLADIKDSVALMLTDIMMPVLDGAAAITVALTMKPNLPIIAVSGLDANAKILPWKRDNRVHFLPKPFSADQLLQLLKSALTQNTE